MMSRCKNDVKDECGAIESTYSWHSINAVTKTWDWWLFCALQATEHEWRELEPGDLKTKQHTGEISSIRKQSSKCPK